MNGDLNQIETEEAASANSEGELVAQARAGNRAALGQLFQRHYSANLTHAKYILRDVGGAEDELQIACLKAFEHLDQYSGKAAFSTWLRSIVVNQCLMALRTQRRARVLSIDQDPSCEGAPPPLQLPARDADPEQQLLTGEIRAILDREMCRIPPILREAFLLHHVQELPLPSVAQRLNLSLPAVKSRLHRARLELRSRIAPRIQ